MEHGSDLRRGEGWRLTPMVIDDAFRVIPVYIVEIERNDGCSMTAPTSTEFSRDMLCLFCTGG